MRSWRHIEPTSGSDSTAIIIETTEAEIVAMYFPYWRERMIAAGKTNEATIENCIDDWVVVHWAQIVEPESEVKRTEPDREGA